MDSLTIIFRSYFELVTQLGRNGHSNPVFALDDGVMTSGRPFAFSSIQEVAAECLAHVLRVTGEHGTEGEVLLGGWSYGGVIAVEIAKQLAEAAESLGSAVKVKAVLLFDSPLRAVRDRSEEAHSGVKSAYQRAKLSNQSGSILDTSSSSGSGAENVELEGRIEDHFNRCTDLLTLYHARPAETQPLSCAVHDLRPEQSSYHCDLAVLQELTSVPVLRTVVPGSHWTMMFGEEAKVVARTIRDAL